MEIKFLCPFWGSENDTANIFLDKVIRAGFSGVEIRLPSAENFTNDFLKELEAVRKTKPDFIFIPQQILNTENENADSYISKLKMKLNELAALKPSFINSHTGKDYFSFDENCRAIEAALNIAAKTGVRILHETHRGRFSFHAATLIRYLKKFPELELAGDFSHFCVVSESMLQDQQEVIEKIIPHVSHIHARVGFEQAPQVNDPAAPEWQNHLNQFIVWWQQIIDYRKSLGKPEITITPEFGPAPYMPAIPFNKQPTADQWAANIFMTNKLKNALK